MLIAKTFIILVFCYEVYADDLQSNTTSYKGIPHRYSYKNYRNLGNHPPIFETFDNVPVEEDQIKLEKVRKEKSVSEENSEASLRVLFDKDEEDSTAIKFNTKRIKKRSTLLQLDTVAPNNVTETKSENILRVPKHKRRQRIPKREKPVEKQNKNFTVSHNVAEKIDSGNDSKVIELRTFPKRPAEFNPVFKKRTREKDPVVKIIRENNNVYAHSGNFHYSFEGGDGTLVSSQGELKSFADKTTGESVSGSVFYKDNDGNEVSLTYTADENGYQPKGAHLPTPPPIPPQIARALAYLATKSTPQPVTEAYNTDY